jgi:hypothetical protein
MEAATPATAAPKGRRELPGKPGKAKKARQPWPPRRKRWLAVALGVLLGLVGDYWWSLVSLGGDYLNHPRFAMSGPVRLRARPFPFASQQGGGRGYAFYALMPGGRIALAWPGDRALIRTDLEPLPGAGGEEYLGYYEHGPESGLFATERFPIGSLDELHRAYQQENFVAFVRLAKALNAEMPERLTPKYWIVAGLLANNKRAEGLRLLERWRADFAADAGWRGAWYLRSLDDDALASSPVERKRYADWERAVSLESLRASPGNMPLDDLMAWVASQAGEPSYRTRSLRAKEGGSRLHPSHALRLAKTFAVFHMALGERDRAVDLLLGALNVAGGVEDRLAGNVVDFAVATSEEAQVLERLIDLLLRAEWGAEALERVWPRVERALRRRPAATKDDARTLADPAFRFRTRESRSLEWEVFWLGSLSAQARLALLLEGVRARHYFETRGAWPPIGPDGSLENLLLAPALPIVDPSRPDCRLQAALVEGGLRLWSVGPDGVDQRGAVDYSPRNGTDSPGDVTVTLLEAPKWDFPAGAGHVYRDLAEWEERYPNGLPFDLYSNGEPLRLSRDGTNRLWSYGPDFDGTTWGKEGRTLPPGEEVEPLHDTRHGSSGDGDLWVAIPFADGVGARAAAPDPVGPPEPAKANPSESSPAP